MLFSRVIFGESILRKILNNKLFLSFFRVFFFVEDSFLNKNDTLQ